jgi:hypothetical protein
MLKVRQGVALFAVGFAYMGCSAQAEPDYLGEPLATVAGTVVTTDAPPNGDIDAALLWLPAVSSERTLKLASAVVRGSFPASFTLEVLAPPPPGPDPEAGGVRLGMIAAIKHGSGSAVPITDIVGVDASSIVIYFPNDSQAANDVVAQQAAFFKVPPTRGYHLAKTLVTEESEARSYRCEYDGLCEHYDVEGFNDELTPEAMALMQRFEDRKFALCTKYLPDAQRCEITRDSDPENDPCSLLVRAREKRHTERVEAEGEAGFCELPWSHVENPDDMARPVTVTLGTTIDDFYYPSTLSFPEQTE